MSDGSKRDEGNLATRLAKAVNAQTLTDEVSAPYNQAKISYAAEGKIPEGNKVEGIDAFRKQITDFYKHLHQAGQGGELKDETAYATVKSLLNQIMEKEGGFEEAFRRATTGQNGGLEGVLNSIHEGIVQQHEHHYTVAKLDELLPEPGNLQAEYDAVGQITRAMGADHLPEHLKGKSPEEIHQAIGGPTGAAQLYARHVRQQEAYLRKKTANGE